MSTAQRTIVWICRGTMWYFGFGLAVVSVSVVAAAVANLLGVLPMRAEDVSLGAVAFGLVALPILVAFGTQYWLSTARPWVGSFSPVVHSPRDTIQDLRDQIAATADKISSIGEFKSSALSEDAIKTFISSYGRDLANIRARALDELADKLPPFRAYNFLPLHHLRWQGNYRRGRGYENPYAEIVAVLELLQQQEDETHEAVQQVLGKKLADAARGDVAKD